MGEERDAWSQAGRITAFGLTTGVTMLICGAVGVWLDRHLGTTPLLTVVLFLVGGGSALWYGIVSFLK